MRRGQNELVKDSYEAGGTILGGAAVWIDDEMKAYNAQASGESMTYGGVALHDAAVGEMVTVFKGSGDVGIGLATDGEEFPAGSPLTVDVTTGTFEIGDEEADEIYGRACSPTAGGDGETFEVELFYPPKPAPAA